MLLVARIIYAGHHVGHPEMVTGKLPDDDVVLVVTSDRDADIGPRRPGCLQHKQLGAVAAAGHVFELGLEGGEPAGAVLDDAHLMAHAQQRTRHVGAGLSTSNDDRVHQASSADSATKARRALSIISIAVRVGQIVVSPCSA